MKIGLIAPQFGLLRSPATTFESEPVPLPKREQTHLPTSAAAFGTSIIVKRRRLPVAPSPGEGTARLDEPKIARVYRLDRAPSNEVVESASAASVVEGPAAPTSTQPRRRANAARRPLVISHQVFDPIRENLPHASPIENSDQASDWRHLREALRRLDETLLSLARGQAISRSLDELLCGYAVGAQPHTEREN